MNIKIRYFASLREKAGKSREDFSMSAPLTLTQIYDQLSTQYGFPLKAQEIKFSVNNEYVDEKYELRENDELVFIPPVAGG